MSLGLIHYSCVSMILVKGLVLDIKTDDRNAQVIQMTAKKYEFSPAQVHVKLGMKVQLKIQRMRFVFGWIFGGAGAYTSLTGNNTGGDTSRRLIQLKARIQF
jgi:hypothetical protein